ncbi:3-oxoacyl-ACP reductase FabG [Nocardioides endophyticus]|uniref:3-oxoacyl-ACP reductase FabG n=1 Tax=Nocardioides endophyticus TaxID=1353775 RepID=A0ABP8YEZ1_9ACTN
MTERVAIVTGAARGIGLGIATRLAGDGYPVALVDADEAAVTAAAGELAKTGARTIAIAANVTVTDDVENAVSRVAAELGAPTIMVNNAGITRDNLLAKMSDDDWDSVIAVHLRGPFLFCRAVQGYMREAQWGRIVNMSSIGARGNRGQANYSTVKAGIQGFTKALAFELGPFNVTANAVGPGFVETDMTRRTAERLGMSFDDFVKRAADSTPVRRVGQPADIASAVSYLVRDESSFVSGQVLYVSGGPVG